MLPKWNESPRLIPFITRHSMAPLDSFALFAPSGKLIVCAAYELDMQNEWEELHSNHSMFMDMLHSSAPIVVEASVRQSASPCVRETT